ncbi:cadherin domain-containing protein [Costertonia aggregata]|uniref:Cadherin domain-containing protein n=1 Tax=Costertonia aggregata TaxID=343403 RepID=A0A7H9ARE9_9FLAO|nr:cadherin domain-containing protein [Costertonia aggregata]QLG46010.1 cadherin domain-containing protein [Costertonia aggregata]
MKKVLLLLPALFVIGCSSDSDTINEDLENSAPQINVQSFQVDEHSVVGTVIGTVTATDANNDVLTYTIDNSSGLEINEDNGELRVGNTAILDFETAQSLSFTVSVFDGTTIAEQEFTLTFNDVNEYDLLTDTEKETVDYFKYLTLWQGPSNTPRNRNSRWQQTMKLYLDGQISQEFRTNVIAVVSEYNMIFEDSDFSIELVETMDESNTHLFFGEVADVEAVWQDMFNIINGNTFSGYAISNGTVSQINSARIWISNIIPVLTKHELGHTLGFGHSDKCETENSFMCSSIGVENDILDIEKEVLKYAYDNRTSGGLTSNEIETTLANLILLDR